MLWKLILTLSVVLLAYGLLRSRLRDGRGADGGLTPRLVPLSTGAMRVAASVILAVMATGSSIYVLQTWLWREEIVQVQVINANTGAVVTYEAKRGTLDGRRFRTTDGREIRMADVERMIVLPRATPP